MGCSRSYPSVGDLRSKGCKHAQCRGLWGSPALLSPCGEIPLGGGPWPQAGLFHAAFSVLELCGIFAADHCSPALSLSYFCWFVVVYCFVVFVGAMSIGTSWPSVLPDHLSLMCRALK